MIPYRFWRGNDFGLGETAGLPAGGATTLAMDLPRSSSDTLLEVIAFPSVRMFMGTSSQPTLGWWVSAEVRCVFGWDPLGAVTDVDMTFEDTDAVLGWCELFPEVSYTGTTTGYAIVWKPLGDVYRFRGRRKGDGGDTLPGVTATFWTLDQHGVFNHAVAYSTLFATNLTIRALWGTDIPAPP